ncbi:NlpC/P60 family protein [Arthrobacter roseus]|uniref:NlpC/P60 family protein n=1 Tax=Arthrobacter roseus TaxID=136274 RepID=UPI001965E9B1|nr:NlpC/P60 family protein [Arthrobacter roseus]MBM7847757.1 cell wall-associated NlpC family hydrolase [Arthrobacter roseus]
MTPRATISRHRADVQRSTPLTSLAKAVTSNAGGVGRSAAVIAAASGLVLTSGVAANAAPVSPDRQSVTTTLEMQAAPTTVTVAPDANVSFERQAAVAAVAAPVVEAPVVQAVANEVTQTQPAVVEQVAAPAAPAAQTPAPVVEAPAPVVEAPAPAVTSGVGATVAAAAKAQVGVSQDCTRLVSNALAAAGINFHGWPIGYMSLGTVVGAAQAQPGDLIYYDDAGAGVPHIAVYIGGGQAVHGGFNGGTTAIAPAELGSGGVYIQLGG